MRLKIVLDSADPIQLPKYYQHILQGVIYQQIEDPAIQQFLHNQGFQWNKRSFKPLTFSWLFGRFNITENQIIFLPPVTFYISSPWSLLMEKLSSSFIKKNFIFLGKQKVIISEVEMMEEPIFQKQTMIQALSPITIYSTFETADSKKIIHYYDVRDLRFSELIRLNLIKKAHAFYNEDLSGSSFSISPVGKVNYTQQKTIRYKSFLIKGWMGAFLMEGDVRLQKVAYHMGLGGKNGIGMGFVEVINSRRR